MSSKFYAVNRETDEKWVSPVSTFYKEYLILYDSGGLGIVNDDGFYQSVTALDMKVWKLVFKDNMKFYVERNSNALPD